MFVASFFVLCVGVWSGVVADDVCTIAVDCVSDLTENDCEPGYVLRPNSSILNCCPGCVLASEAAALPTNVCQAPSTCLDDGTFAPVQCKGDLFVGRCFCTDAQGSRIFGQMWRIDAGDMTCGCSRRRAELEASGVKDSTLHCTPSGDFEELQCTDGLCWCAEPKTGAPLVTPVLEEDMTRLPCYDQDSVGEKYLRRCESIVHALAVIHDEQSAHGTNFLGQADAYCDYDGSYGAYQVSGQVVYCTGPDAAILGAWQAMFTDRSGMDCHCARDSTLYFPERGMSFSMQCNGNGNYQPLQMSGDMYYCVDSDGYPVTDFTETAPADNCASYA